jgi:hypothetical protein
MVFILDSLYKLTGRHALSLLMWTVEHCAGNFPFILAVMSRIILRTAKRGGNMLHMRLTASSASPDSVAFVPSLAFTISMINILTRKIVRLEYGAQCDSSLVHIYSTHLNLQLLPGAILLTS